MKRIAEIEQNGATTPMWRSLGLIFVRYGIGGTMILAGVILLIAVPGDLGAYGCASAVGAGMSVLLLNLLFRMSVSGDRDRELEEQARRYFDEHGEWPDDETPERGRRQWTLAPGVLTAEQAEETHDFSGPSVPLVRPASPRPTAIQQSLPRSTL